ncbi:DUF6221 family protein [Sphaerisporangium sp. NPDC051011]|uniref:DUF6221 family protein n=1 Tax=Sphaerisporangium sp. NPDC051011 TaxID=3155792 RepID=UPI0033DB2C56
MNPDLQTFLRARLDQDEQLARRASEHASAEWLVNEHNDVVLWWPPDPDEAENERRLGHSVTADSWRGADVDRGMAPHIARHDPARVLREVEAKRKLLGHYEDAVVSLANAGPNGEVHDLMTGAVNTLRAVLIDHVQIYADHPDYREEWRP